MKTLYLCGAGNSEVVRLALAVNRAQNRWDKVILLDDDPSRHGESILGVEIIGAFSLLEKAEARTSEVVNNIARSSVRRWMAWKKLEQYGLPFADLIHPSVDTEGVTLGKGVTAYKNSTIGSLAKVGDGSILFMGSIAGHGCSMGRCCILAPNSIVNARVTLEDGIYLGTNAALMPEIHVGGWATIGACSAVISDVPIGATVMGVPSKIIMTLQQKLRSEVDENLPPDIRDELCSQIQA